MALKRETLKAMGLTEEQVNAIIADHTATVEGIKATYESQVTALKADYEKVNNSLTDANKKYADKTKEFDDYKVEIAGREKTATIKSAFKSILTGMGITDKRADAIVKVSDLSKVELNDDGTIKNADKLTESAKADWSEFIPTNTQIGANVSNPPASQNIDLDSMSDADYYKYMSNKKE